MSDEPRKRSRFDRTEPEPKRTSRFDRRSRSPPARTSENRRSRSPLSRSSGTPDGGKKDAAAAAAAAAARINASLEAKRGIQHVDVPPIRSTSSNTKSRSDSATLNGDIYQQDGDYIKDIEVNDLRNRYTLTKGATQKMIKDETGADVTTRGNYYPDKSMATAANPPLYLHVTSQTKEGLEKAVKMIEDLMQQELPNLVDERRFKRQREPEQVERDEHGRRKWPEERIPIDLEPIPGFNLRAQVVGHGGAYVKHIQSETRCRVQIKGRGSGFYEHNTGVESDEPMYLHVAGPDANDVQRARELCEDLLQNVKEQYQQFKENGRQRGFGGGGGGGDRGGHNRGGNDRERGGGYNRDSQSYDNTSRDGYAGYGGSDASASASGGQTAEEAWAQYYAAAAAAQAQGQGQGQAADGSDPYAAYGGYQGYVNAYYMYQQQMAMAQGGAAAGTPGTPGYGADPSQQGYGSAGAGVGAAAGSPPPPPPGNEQPPPPPPPGADYAQQQQQAPPPPPPPGTSGSSGAGGYNAVPPPPGM